MIRTYEIMFIAIADEKREENVSSVVEKIQAEAESVLNVDMWGEKRLAYEIQDLSTGYYVLVEFKASPAQIKEIDRWLKIKDFVLRYMIVRKN